MGQYFEITYSPSVWGGGYGGLHVQAPENLIAPQFSPALSDVTLRNSEVRSRPKLVKLLAGGFAPAVPTDRMYGVTSFLSRGGVFHTVMMNIDHAWQLLPNSASVGANGDTPWSLLIGPTIVSVAEPVRYSYQCFKGVLYWVNGSNSLSAWDGASGLRNWCAFTGATNPPVGGQVLFGAKYLGILDNHVILASVIEGPTSYPQRIRWSNTGFDIFGAGSFASNLGTASATFDPTISVNAGVVDILETPDIITGLITLGRVGYVLRTNGITEMTPTGQGTAPFVFNHLWANQNGIGNMYPWGWAQYGNMGVIVSLEQVYRLDAGQVTPIGGGARDAILADLATASAGPLATIMPCFSLGMTYLTYQLYIPINGGVDTRVWVYSFEDNNWVNWTLPGVTLTGVPNMCYTGDTVVTVPSGSGSGSINYPMRPPTGGHVGV